jgi:hypothetical protein
MWRYYGENMLILCVLKKHQDIKRYLMKELLSLSNASGCPEVFF